MAAGRMIKIGMISSDAFLEMPISSQGLYFHLCMRADDDGFVDSPKKVCRECQASLEDLENLKEKRYILAFDSGVVLIKHWFIHNTISRDRYHETLYKEEKALVVLKDNKSYTECEHVVYNMETEIKLNKTKLNKDKDIMSCKHDDAAPSLEEKTEKQEGKNKPPYKEIIDYLNECSGKHYRDTTKATQTIINGRFKDGFTLEDFITVIGWKCKQWVGDPKMESYLRPETLFAPSHFESYLNELPKSKAVSPPPIDEKDDEPGIDLWGEDDA